MVERGDIDTRLSERLRALRQSQGWSLDELAERASVSRASLSRLEKGEVSPTAQVLSRICAAYGLSLTRLMYMIEEPFAPLVRREDQPVLHDTASGFQRRALSPPAGDLAAEVLECTLQPGSSLDYDGRTHAGMEHHLVLLEGRLTLEIDTTPYELSPGDCLRYRVDGPNRFSTSRGARYILVIL